MNVSLDAPTGAPEVDDLCLVLTADAKAPHEDLLHREARTTRTWVTRSRTRLMTAFGRNMTISDIPDVPEISDKDLCGTLDDPTWTDPETGMIHTKPLSEFPRVRIKGGSNRTCVFNAAAAISVSTRIRDEAALSVDSRTISCSCIPWKTVKDLRAQRFEVRKRLRFLLTRNTMPLIMSPAFMKVSQSVYPRGATHVNAADVQFLYDQYMGKHNFSARDIFMGGGIGELPPFSEPYLYGRRMGDSRLKYSGSRTTAEARMSVFIQFVLDEMHPSAHDPKFRDRFEDWVRDWPASQDAAYRWIRTWSGRLRRLQATRYKRENDIVAQLDSLVTGYVARVRDMRAARLYRADVENARSVDGVLCFAFAPLLRMSPEDLLPYVLSSLWRAAPTAHARCDDDPEILARIEAAFRVGALMPSAPLICTRTPEKLSLLDALPEAWRAGAQHTLNAVERGETSLYGLLTDMREHPQRNERALAEFVRPTPNIELPKDIRLLMKSAPTLYAGIGEMNPHEAGSRLAFVRGKLAAKLILAQDKSTLTPEQVVTITMNRVKI